MENYWKPVFISMSVVHEQIMNTQCNYYDKKL